MTELLEKAFEDAENLPEDDQDAFVALIFERNILGVALERTI